MSIRYLIDDPKIHWGFSCANTKILGVSLDTFDTPLTRPLSYLGTSLKNSRRECTFAGRHIVQCQSLFCMHGRKTWVRNVLLGYLLPQTTYRKSSIRSRRLIQVDYIRSRAIYTNATSRYHQNFNSFGVFRVQRGCLFCLFLTDVTLPPLENMFALK